MKTINEQGYTFQEWLSPEQIAKDVQQVADRISEDYKGKEPLFVVVLNGAFVFASDLLRALKGIHCDVTFTRVSSYSGMASTGTLDELQALEANSIRVATMLFKPNKLERKDAKPDYIGHEITDDFVIGYGLDFDGYARNLPAIYKIKK